MQSSLSFWCKFTDLGEDHCFGSEVKSLEAFGQDELPCEPEHNHSQHRADCFHSFACLIFARVVLEQFPDKSKHFVVAAKPYKNPYLESFFRPPIS